MPEIVQSSSQAEFVQEIDEAVIIDLPGVKGLILAVIQNISALSWQLRQDLKKLAVDRDRSGLLRFWAEVLLALDMD